MLSPGTYLRKRRTAAGLTIPMVADLIARFPWAIRPVTVDDVRQLVLRLRHAEHDRDNLTVDQARILRNAFQFDIDVYQALLLRHHAPEAARFAPEPQLCRICACSWRDACVSPQGHGCAWVLGDPTLCTACEHIAVAEAELARSSAAEAELAPDPARAAAEFHSASAAL